MVDKLNNIPVSEIAQQNVRVSYSVAEALIIEAIRVLIDKDDQEALIRSLRGATEEVIKEQENLVRPKRS